MHVANYRGAVVAYLLKARVVAEDLDDEVDKIAIPVETGDRKKVLQHAPLDTPDDAGASYGSNYGSIS